jgi:hypothetical protein
MCINGITPFEPFPKNGWDESRDEKNTLNPKKV